MLGKMTFGAFLGALIGVLAVIPGMQKNNDTFKSEIIIHHMGNGIIGCAIIGVVLGLLVAVVRR
jgi:hypothetical protein